MKTKIIDVKLSNGIRGAEATITIARMPSWDTRDSRDNPLVFDDLPEDMRNALAAWLRER